MILRFFWILMFGAMALVAGPASAIPNIFINGNFIGPVIPAHPRFGANLTGEFLSAEAWKKGEFSGPWSELSANNTRQMNAMPVVFGAVPESIVLHEETGGSTREIVISYLNAGTFFGYKFGGEKSVADRETGSEKRSEFAHLYGLISKNLRERLESGCGAGEQVVIGRSDLLRSVYTDYYWENFTIRLARRDNHSISLHLMPKGAQIDTFVAPEIAALDKNERFSHFSARVKAEANSRGDTFIEGIPMFEQGNTPFCGIHTLAMAGDYLGLNLGPDELAAGADFKNTGSARGSNILELYHAAAEELGMKLRVSSRFEFDRVEPAIKAGMPVIVWRRVSKEREIAHISLAEKISVSPTMALPDPSKSESEKWPQRSKKGSPSHASLITGLNADLGEVIFTDPWGETARNKRMRIEEMEATAYTVFFFEF